MVMKKSTAIICAYNEAKTIEEIIATVCNYFFDEIIIVNDGSTDNTDEILKGMSANFNFKYIALPANQGKGFAMATALENAKHQIIVFIDADLTNLNDDHSFELINPMINKEADMVLGQPSETLINYSINPFKSFTGQRALYKADVLPIVETMKKSRFGVETLINLFYQSKGKTVKYVMLKELKHPTKFDKVPKQQAVKEFIKEGREIALTAFKNFDLVVKSAETIIRKSL